MSFIVQREQYRLLEIQPVHQALKRLTNPALPAAQFIPSVISKDEDWVDITKWVLNDSLEIEDHAYDIDTLKVTVSVNVEWLIESIFRGMRIRFKGGYVNGHQEWLFAGFVSNFDIMFGEDGRLKLSITAFDDMYRMQLIKPGPIAYPVQPWQRSFFAREFQVRDEITIKEIIEGIVAEYDVKIGVIDILTEYNYQYTFKNPLTQNENESDYEFLRRIISGYGSRTAFSNASRRHEVVEHAHGMMFMETSGTESEPNTIFRVESEIRQFDKDPKGTWQPAANNVVLEAQKERNSIEFVYQRFGSAIVDPDVDTIDKPDSRMIMTSVSIEEYQEDSKIKPFFIINANPRKKRIPRKKRTEPTDEGDAELSADQPEDGGPDAPDEIDVHEETPSGGAAEPEGGWNAWEPNREMIKAAYEAHKFDEDGVVKEMNVIDFLHKWPWEKAQVYFTRRTILFPSSAAPISPATKVPDPLPIGKGKGKGGEKQKGKEITPHRLTASPNKPHKWGITLSAELVHGNPLIVSRKRYKVSGLVGRYSANNWFMISVTHKFDDRYRISIKMGL